MVDKDESYDPLAEYDSETERGDGEEDWSTHNLACQEMNNTKVHSHSHPGSLMGAFVYNNTSDSGEVCEGDGGWRRGGPLMDTGGSHAQAQALPLKKCINPDCGNLTHVWYQGTRFQCDEWYAEEPEEIEAHNQLCLQCATDEERCPTCPVHPNASYKYDVDTNVIPDEVHQ